MRKMKGIKEVAGATQSYCQKDGYGHTIQINYDSETDRMWYDEHISPRSWVPYGDTVYSIFTRFPMTMNDIREAMTEFIETFEE